MKIIDTTPENIHQFGMCGYNNTKNEGYQQKLKWTRDRFAVGLRYKMLVSDDQGAVGGIEYLPGEQAWRPVEAGGYLFIHCIFIMKKNVKGKGYGRTMVQTVIDDARSSGAKGVAVVTRKGSWMVGRELFLGMGFSVTDNAKPDFELLALKFDSGSLDPVFVSGFDDRLKNYTEGLHIFTSAQCPYTWKAVTEITEAAEKEFGIRPNIIYMHSGEQARQAPFPFGTFGIVIDGKVVADHPISATRFKNIMKKAFPKN